MAEPVDPKKQAGEVLKGRLKRVFPGDYMDKSLDEIKDLLKQAQGDTKRKLQKAKKLLEQQDRLLEKDLGD